MSRLPTRPLKIFVSAAEASGDEHAANLILALRRRWPDAQFMGVAGERMAAAGCEVLADLTRKASMLGGPFLRLGYYYRTIRRLQRDIRRIAPDIHIPVDSPAMNWHLAAAAKSAGAKVVYYVAPQVWAWATWRVKKLARLTDHVACILPFEEAYLRQRGVVATFVGHPIYDGMPAPPAGPDFADAWYHGHWRVALLPGSRPGEIHGHAEALASVAMAIARRWPKAQFTFATLTEEGAELIRRHCAKLAGNPKPGVGQPTTRNCSFPITVGKTAALDVLAQSNFAVVGSGTVTLQAAYFGVPMVVCYRTGLLMRMLYHVLGRGLGVLSTPHLSLVNILAGRRIIPELMPWKGDARPLTATVLEVMNDLGCLHEMRRDMLKAIAPLCPTSSAKACENAADVVVRVWEQRPNARP